MTQPAETFCAAMRDVSCPVCPLRGIVEAQWAEVAPPDTRNDPVEAAADVGHVAIEVADAFSDPEVPVGHSDELYEDDAFDDSLAGLAAAREVASEQGYDDAYSPAGLAGRELHGRGWNMDDVVGEPAHPAAVAVGGCASKFIDRSCAVLDPRVVEQLRERGPSGGANELWRIASAGSDDRVTAALNRLGGWAEGEELALALDADASPTAQRSYLLRIAAHLRAIERPA